MPKWSHFYLVRIEFLGFRYHGWQKQPDQITIHQMIDKTFAFIFKHDDFKTLGCSRTDSKVSADDFVVELFANEELNLDKLLHQLNINLPPDIKAKSISTTDAAFNVIQDVKSKEYHYHFCFGEPMHPNNSPFMCHVAKDLNIDLMQKVAAYFEGTHNFKRYATKPSENAVFERKIEFAKIEVNDKIQGAFAPENSYVFNVKSKGFLRYQVRLMMGALIEVGRGSWTFDDFKESLSNPDGEPLILVAPSSGLVLHKVEY